MTEISVTKGMADTVDVVVKEQISVLLKKDSGGDWETKTETIPFLDAPVKAGEKVGEVVYFINGEEKGRADLVTAETVEKADLWTMLERMLRLWL